MIGRIGDRGFVFVESAAGSDICFDADDRFDVVRVSLVVEFNHPEHISMVRNGNGVHSVLFAGMEQAVEGYGAIEQRVLTVQVKMRKSFIFHRL